MFDIDHLYLASYNYGKINETVVTGGDNFEVTVGLSKTEGLTEEQLEQNGLLDCMMTLLKDVENSINCLYRSIDNDTDLAESLSKQLPISKSNKHLAYNFGTLHEQVERRNDYINGKKGIGPFALNVTNQMLTYLFGVKFKDTKFTKFTGIWRLDHLVDDNDAYISSWLSAFINANVDIVKDPWVVRLNVNPFTYNILNLLVRSGMGQTGVWFLCQPIIRELASVEERTKSNFSKDPSLPKYKFKQKLIEQVLDKYLIQHDDATISEYTTNSDAQSIQSRIDVVNLILDNKDALRYIAVNPNATMVKLNDGSDVSVSWFQGQIYYAFLSLQKYIQAMNKLVQYTKIDTRKHGKNFIQIQRYLAMYNELFHPQDTSKSLWDLESLKNLADNSWIEYKTVNAINLPLRILANQVYTANLDFSSVVLHFARRLARSASGEYGFTEDLIKKLSNGLQTAIKARYMSAYAKQVLGRSDEYVRELFYGSSPLISIARRLNGLKYAIESVPEFERLKGNYIIEKLRPQPQQENVALSDGSVARQPQFITIDSNIDGSRTNENMMIDAWKDLLNDPNERVRMFAEDLILYTFFTTGEYKGWNKLFKYVPPAWRRGEIRGGTVDVDGIQCTSFSDYVEQTLNGRMPDLIPMLQEVISNNFLNYGMCTTMQLKNEDGTYNFINPDASSPVLVANEVSMSDIDSMPLYISVKKPNTKGRKASSYNVYKMTGEINATNGVYPIYTMIEKRGYSQFNNDIYEYGIDLQYKENETKIPNASAEEIESRISDACEKIESTGKQGHKWTWNEILIDLTGAFYGESANDDVATDEQSSVPSEPNMTQQSGSQPSQATTGIKYESDGGVSVEYTPTGKQKQTYTVKGNKIFNKNGDEVFKEDSVDRNKIFANLAILQGRAVIVEHKGIKYVVNNRNQIISGATGKIMQWGEDNGDRNAIIQAAEKRFKEKDVKTADDNEQQTTQFTWARTSDNSYEVSTLASKNKMSKQEGDARFSALNAKFKDGTIIDGIDVGGMTIEDVYQNIIKKSGKGKAPSRNSKLFVDTTPKLKGKMSFAFGNQRANGVTATTTLEAIKRGERTATTRYTSDGNIDYWKQAKVGDVIEFSGQNGEKVLVRVTKELHQLPTSTTAEEWSVKEGWDTSRFEQRVKPKIDKGQAYQMEFEYIDQSKEAMEDSSYSEGYLPLWQEWARQNPELIEELRINANGKTLTDQFAGTKERPGRVSQARALADILNSQYKSNSQNNELLQSTTQPIKTEKTPKNYQKYIDVIQKYFDIGYTTGRIGKDDAKQVIQKLHIHIDEDNDLFDAMKADNLSEKDLLNALYLLASHLDKPEVKGRTKLSEQQIDKLLDSLENEGILTDVLDMTGGIYNIQETNDGLIVDTQLISDLDFLLQNKKYEYIYQELLDYIRSYKYIDGVYNDIVDVFNIDNIDLSGLIQVDSTFDNVNQLELFSDKDFEEGKKNKENCKGK